jgi:hypothetical protein
MKFCPVVPEICRGYVHGPRKERKKENNNNNNYYYYNNSNNDNNNNNNKKQSKNNKSPNVERLYLYNNSIVLFLCTCH